MSFVKKILVVLLVLTVGFVAFAEQSNSNWATFVGTSFFVSHIGASYSVGPWEFGGTLYSAFPNTGIIGYVSEMSEYDSEGTAEKPNLLSYLGQSFQLGYAGTLSASYDLVESNDFDFDMGLSIAGMYTEVLEGLGIKGGVVSADVTMKGQLNLGDHGGVYLATELPLAGFLLVNQTSNGETTTSANFFTFTLEGYLSAALMLAVYTTRVGYVYRF